MRYRLLAALLAATGLCSAQMTPQQKNADFVQLASTYAINYGPLQWKLTALNVDVLNIDDWLRQAVNSADDLGFYEVCVAYVASLNDAHDYFQLPSDFEAALGFYADIYDGKILIDYIDRTQLSSRRYPFQIGDELVSIDGTAASDLVQSFLTYSVAANAISTQRVAAQLLTVRPQGIMPHASQIGAGATVVINRQGGGAQTYVIPWAKAGTELTFVGPVISPFLPDLQASAHAVAAGGYMAPLTKLRNMRLPDAKFAHRGGALQPLALRENGTASHARHGKFVVGLDDSRPVFDMPAGFQIRMGANDYDFLYTGTFPAAGFTIGYIRIPDFEYDFSKDLETELAYMQQNTDGLIVDVMRNPGGDGCVAENAARHFFSSSFQTIGLEVRATWGWVVSFEQALQQAQAEGASGDVIAQYQALLQQVQQAYATPSGRTSSLPICSSSLTVQPLTDLRGNLIAYTKPMMLLTDEFTASAAEMFSGIIQDNQRAVLFGARTMGAGGNVNDYPVTTYSFAGATVTESLMSRKNPISTPDFPATSYVENVGVRPDIAQEYMTADNLTNHGATFVQAFTGAMVQYISSQQ